jgi:hypothetical protein
MAVAKIAHKPGLTKEQAMDIFRKQFAGKYEVESWKGPLVGSRRDFVVVKNPWTGVSVKLEQAPAETRFVYSGLAPRVWARIMFAGGLGFVLVGFLLWNGLTAEVKQFIENAPEFK